MVLIDTNIFIYYMKNDKTAVEYFSELKNSGEEIFFSFINKIELLGFSKLDEKEKLKINHMLNEFLKIGYDEGIEDKTIEIKNKFNLKIPDAIIAASAVIYNCTLVTRNISDFNGVVGLSAFNPYKN